MVGIHVRCLNPILGFHMVCVGFHMVCLGFHMAWLAYVVGTVVDIRMFGID